MRGSLIYCPNVSNDDPVTTRIFRLTDASDYEITLENGILEPFLEYYGSFVRTGSLTVTPWNPDLVSFHPDYPNNESLRLLTRWRYQVSQSTTQLPSRAERCKVFH